MHKIYYHPDFDEQAKKLGGIPTIDKILRPLYEAIERNPYAFRSIENEYIRCRYNIVRRIGNALPLLVIFEIDDQEDVCLLSVEEYAAY